MKLSFLILLAALCLARPLAAGEPDHSLWDRVLQKHVNAIGEVDYAALKSDRAKLDAYLGQLAAVSPDSDPERFAGRDEQLAYWINAYNALTVGAVVDLYPIASVRKADDFFGRRSHRAGGRLLSLRDIEHKILRERLDEPRIHFVIVCASVSCPMLERRAFFAGDLEQRLEVASRRFLNEKRNVTVDLARKRLTLNKILDWYADDFHPESPDGSVRGYIVRYADEPLRESLIALGPKAKPRHHDYDWSLNSPGARSRSKYPLEREAAR